MPTAVLLALLTAASPSPSDSWVAVPPPPLPAGARLVTAYEPAPPAARPIDELSGYDEGARAGDPDDQPPARVVGTPAGALEARPDSPEQESSPVLGIELGAGLPEGFAASIVVRPWRALRLFAGGLNNTLSSGVRGGLTLAPISFPLAPTLTVEAGALGSADLTPALRWAGGDQVPEGFSATGSYRFASARLGLELGAPRRFVVFVRAGLSWIEATAYASAQTVRSGEMTASFEPGELRFRSTMPSAELGFTLYPF